MNYDREIELLAHPENFEPPQDEELGNNGEPLVDPSVTIDNAKDDETMWDSIMAEAESHQPD